MARQLRECGCTCETHILEAVNRIDIGGQDTKIICVEQGFVKDFMMNDKCSAGIKINRNRYT